ncbi:MAG: 4Fe-4S dicluster domain-containing protein [Raoultibacter sp.]
MTKYGMAIDLTRCAGCQTCVVTCQLHNNQRPGIAWGHVDALESGKWPDSKRVYLSHACMHCEDAPCVSACPTGASVKRDDGIVTIDYEACIGCGNCIAACPYGARTLSMDDVWFFDAKTPSPYEAEGVQRIKVAEKCIFCCDRIKDGSNPYCVDACPTSARIFGDLDDSNSQINAYIKDNNAENLPNTSMYYVKGDYDIDLPGALMVASAHAPETKKVKEKKKEENNPTVPIAIGAGVVVAAGAAAGIGYSVNKKNKNKSAASAHEGKDDE